MLSSKQKKGELTTKLVRNCGAQNGLYGIDISYVVTELIKS